MKRRTFTVLSALGGLAVLQTWGLSSCSPDERQWQMAIPESLIPICGPDTLREIGSEYLAMFPAESEEAVLSELLTAGLSGSNDVLTEQLENKIAEEYRQDKVIQVAGWLLSMTEARQCALYSLLKS